MKNKIKVLIVDDSAFARQSLASILSSDEMIEVMATAPDPFIAAKKINHEVPDVITLDVDMPKMDGLTFLKKIMSQHPIPVVIISAITRKGSIEAIRALEYGAVEVIPKPRMVSKDFFTESRIAIIDAVKAAAISKLKRKLSMIETSVNEKLPASVIIPDGWSVQPVEKTDRIVAVGASTGGTEAIRIFLEQLTPASPAVVIVQHMPELFTAAFARRLDSMLSIRVSEATNGDRLMKGHALIAPGNHHLLVKRRGGDYFVELKDGPLVNRHRPSVDVLFRSVARAAGSNAIGIIMTGMGDDGARGLLEMRQTGAMTIAQDEESCVVYGMPREAVKLNAAEKILPLRMLAGALQ